MREVSVSDLEAVRRLAEPVVGALGLRLYDVELTGSGRTTVLRVLVDQEGGIDLEAISAAAEAVSAALDHAPPAALPPPDLDRTVRPRQHLAGEQPRAQGLHAEPRRDGHRY